ncbi:UbiD family decarboxylase [Paenibacillus popilliae]|uniref:3-polyprenyl-4-hydroxybenzoate decarboxylase n=1 Tax=Paenibacillus popilliae ATCC 14706 TaxID=1212764 RepID=M9LZX3_PAEPP|nr:UbiD family decarboxylase [Paenibacillus popilliae]GAC41959.1 3-polyprenyl-4-hydroxybenzoate decarboxylase [Paenibacillus popilliae ATCC 14706]
MSFSNIRSFIHTLKRENELAVIEAEVDPYLEIAEIHRRVIEEGGPALLFTNVKGSPFSVATNLFGTTRRVDMAFGPRPEQFANQCIEAVNHLMPPSPKKLWEERSLVKELLGLLKVGMKEVSSDQAPIMDVLRTDKPMKGLPALTSWQLDGGPFITLPLVYTEHPTRTGSDHNLGMYRVQIYDDETTGIHWQIQKGGGFHYHEAELRNEALPVSIYVGGPPALIAAAIAPLPEKLPELLMASFVMGERLPVVDSGFEGHRIPAEAEFAIQGYVPPHERRMEGPFGDHYGYYSWAHKFPLVNVKHMYHRKDAIYPATVVGKPRQEDYYLGEYLVKLLSPAFPMVMPSVRKVHPYPETGVHSLAAAVVRESYSREAMLSGFRILGEGQLSLTKFLLLTDQDVDLDNFAQLMENVLERFQPESDLYVLNNTSHDTLDYTGHKLNHGSKGIMLGVGEPVRELPHTYEGGPIDEISDVAVFCRGCLTMSGASYEAEPQLTERLLERLADQETPWPLVFLVDDAQVARTQLSFLWTVFTRFNPASDIYAQMEVRNHHIAYQLPIVIDARMKPGYPDELFPREDIVQRVDARWKDYFPNGV